MKTAEDFKQAAADRNLMGWHIHNCSICGYPCGFVFENGRVHYDSGCDCVSYGPNIQPRTWEDVASQYNMQNNPDYIATMDAFWFPATQGEGK